MKQNRNSTISGQDIYITHRCQVLTPHRTTTRATTVALADDFFALCVLCDLYLRPQFFTQ